MPTPPSVRWVALLCIVAVLASGLAVAFSASALRQPPDADPVEVDPATGAPTLAAKSDAQIKGRYAGLVVRQPQGEETAGIVVDMSGRDELYNEGIYIYTDSRNLDHTAGIQVHNVGAADAMHINLGCRECPPEVLNYTNTGVGIDQWSNGTGFFTFVHGGGKGIDAVLYPSARGAVLGDFRAASSFNGSGDLVRLDNGGNPNVRGLVVNSGWSRLRDVGLDGDLQVGVQTGEDTHAIRFSQPIGHAPVLDANAGWLRVLDGSEGDAERFLVEARSGDVRFTGHVGRGADDGVRIADAQGRVNLTFARAYQATPLVSCTPHGAYACWIAEAGPEGVLLRVSPLAPGADVAGARVDVIVRGT